MSEQDKLTADSPDSAKDKSERPIMLYEVLLEEYKLLGILNASEANEVTTYRSDRGKFYKIKPLLKAEKLPTKEKQEQFDLRQKRRFEVLAKLREVFHRVTATKPVAALCLSGGGIRSATFSLGVIQSLAKRELLDKFHYLSSVSGGGYTASWLSAWIKRSDFDTVQRKLRGEQLEEGQVEAPEIAHLRSYSNFMSPRTGLFSTDTWTLIAVYLRNLLLNWTVLIPLITASLLVPKLFASLLGYRVNSNFQDWCLYITLFLGIGGVCFINMMRPSLKEYSWFTQDYRTDDIGSVLASNKVTFYCALPVLLFAIGTTIVWGWIDTTGITVNHFIMFGVGLFVSGFLLGRVFMMLVQIWNRLNRKDKASGPMKSYHGFFELAFSAISGLTGGLLLYLVVQKIFSVDAAGSGTIFGIAKANFLACFGVPLILTIFLLGATIFTGLAVKFTNDDDREWVTRFGAILLKIIVAWTVISSAVILGPLLFSQETFGGWDSYIKRSAAIFAGLSGVFSVLSGFSSKTPAKEGEPAKDKTSLLITIASSIAAPIFILFLIILISYGTLALTQNLTILSGFNQTAWFVVLAIAGCLMGCFININKFSFHATYRERLIRAYLGASNPNRLAEANSFTGLNTDADNPEMKDLKIKPFHVVNMTLNMVKSSNLAWQNRKAESFTTTKLHSGSSQMGGSGNYRTSEFYGYNSQSSKAITLGTAAAISGAAASPNMGYFTQSTAVSFLMVLLNVRLGWWLGNPGRRGKNTWRRSAPRWSPRTFLSEAFGLTDDTRPYIYLADGGQFENLGLYEMVLRRCRTIIVCDAGADPKPAFFDLGSAIHKIRVDMGIPIDFEKDKEPVNGKYGAVATIKYSSVDGAGAKDGILIYIKPTLDGSEPIDIQHYQKENSEFPHQTTADQFFSEAQFESYRSLGFEMMESFFSGANIVNLKDLPANVRNSSLIHQQPLAE
jgi:hypothetical protein